MSQHSQSITLQNKKSERTKLVELLADFARSNQLPEDIKHDLHLVTEEIFINIVSYAYTTDKSQTIDIEFSYESDTVSITFVDTGIAFNPITDCKKDIERDDHCEGGMGIHLIMSLTEQQRYNRTGQRNVFTVTKHYTQTQES